MSKIVPTSSLSHGNDPSANVQPQRSIPPPRFPPQTNNLETTLVTVYSILQSAAATAYENADSQTGSSRNVALGVVHLIELAQWWVDSLLDKPLTADANSQAAST